MARTQRYWDGVSWTEHVAPQTPIKTPAPEAAGKEAVSNGLWTAGLLLMFFFPIGGVVVGCVILNKWAGGGVTLIVGSIISTMFWGALLTS